MTYISYGYSHLEEAMKIRRRDFIKGCAAAAALGAGSLAQRGAEAAPVAAPAKPGGREILPIPDIPGPYPSALYGKDVQPQPAKPLRPPEGAPNIVIILIDDMGFGATSAFGGPISMPTLERVANEGLKYNRFHTTALCSPTRQALLTGRNHHSVGMGSITETATTAPGYNSIRPNSAATIAETLRLNGYSTGAFGKMHQTPVWEVSASGPFDRWPTGDGFEKFYGFVGAETNQWAPTLYEGTEPVEPSNDPEYHLTPDLVSQATQWVRSLQTLTPDKPFFVYLSFGATHAPHHVPVEWSDKYKGKFDQGWDKVREETLARQKKLGIVPEDCQLTKRSEGIQAWDELDDDAKKVATRLMEIYAGFAEHTDHYAGVFLDSLQEMGVLDNTLVFYMAGDNGASAEGRPSGTYNEMLTINYVADTVENILAHYDDLGTVQAYNHYPVGWAHAMDCPYQWTKQVASHWGGTRNGMAVRWPKGIKAKGQVRSQWHHVIDIAPTILEAAGLPQPVQVHGVTQKPIEGVSLKYSFDDANAPDQHVTQYFEMFGNRGIYHQGWSAITIHSNPFMGSPNAWEDDEWELYDGASDWSQAVHVADQYPDKLAELKDLFMVEAARYNVFPLDDRRTELTNPAIAGRPDLLNGRTSMMFYEGMGQLMENTVPNVKNKSHTVTADIEVPEKANGVIIAQGGRFGGWTLYLKDGVLKYVHNFVGIQEYPVAATSPLPAGRATVQYKFTYEGGDKTGMGGKGELYVNGKKAGEAHIDKTVPFTFSFDETLDIGRDPATPVTADYEQGNNAFNGKIYSVKVDVASTGVAYHEPAENVLARLMANQ
jgi:arylsulfatase A-like enzyme